MPPTLMLLGLIALSGCEKCHAYYSKTRNIMSVFGSAVMNFRFEHGRLPTHIEEVPLNASDPTRPWPDSCGKTIRYERLSARQYRLRAPGIDGRFETTDDLVKTFEAWTAK